MSVNNSTRFAGSAAGVDATVGGIAMPTTRVVRRERNPVVPVVVASIALLPLIKPTGPGNASPVDLVIGLSLVITLAWAVRYRPQLRLPYAAAMALYIGGGTLAALLGPVPGAGMLAIVQDVAMLAWAVAIANALRGPAAVGLVLRTWAWAAVAWASLMIIGYILGIGVLAGFNPEFGDRTALTFADPNMAGTYFVAAVMLVWATQTPRPLGMRLAAYAILLVALALTGSNGSIAALAVSVIVAVLVRSAHRSGPLPTLAMACAGLLALGALVFGGVFGALQERASEGGRTVELTLGRSEQSIEGRQQLKVLALQLYGESGPIGSGPDSSTWRLAQRQAPVATELHDDYLAALVERGLIGACGLALLIGSVAVRARALLHPWLPTAYAELIPRPWALIGALGGLAVAALFYEILHFRHLWALFAVVAAVQLWRER